MAWAATGGNLRGPQGVQGPAGAAGRGIATAAVNAGGELVLTFSDSTSANLGVVKGAKGADGTGIAITGSVANQAALPGGLNGTTDKGKAYVAESDGHLWIWSGTAWVDAGQFKGDKGDSGATGAAGATGPRGTNWYTGNGVPGAIAGSQVGDKYLDLDTGNVYTLN